MRSTTRMPLGIFYGLITDGGMLVCEPCTKEFGLKLTDIAPETTLGAPGVTQGYSFAENARTLTW